MTAYEKYTFFLCLIVFVALTALFTVLLTHVVRLTIRQIKHGLEDEKILKEFYKEQKKPQKSNAVDLIARIFSGVVCVALFATFVFAVFLHVNEDEYANRYGALKVVKSGSMAYPYEKNDYLFDNRLNDQIQMMDLIVTEPLPNEFDLKLYDVVVYEQDGKMIIHRIVGIEEPNANHPNERYFKLQGDAVEIADRYPVRYGQMRAIYRGERVPFVGGFVSFMQSPAGYLCILLVLFAIIAAPLVEKKMTTEREKRLTIILRGFAVAKAVTKRYELRKGKDCLLRGGVCRDCKWQRECNPSSRVRADVKSLNVSVKGRRGSVLWMQFAHASKIGFAEPCKKRDGK